MEESKKMLETEINSVIVYQSGVQLTQVGSIELSTGEQLITITELPDTLDKESIRVKGIGNGKIININVEFNSKKEYRKEAHERLQEEIEKLQKELNRKNIELSRNREQIAKFKETEDGFYTDWSKAFAFGEVGLPKFMEFDDKISELIGTHNSAIDKLEDEIKELTAELRALSNKKSSLGPIEKVYNFYEISLNINVVKEGEFKLEIRYTMGNAWWEPFYDVALSEDNARLTMMANVYNRTETDWNDVDLEISTASLRPIALIKPQPMILQEYYPYAMDGRTRGWEGGRGSGGAPPAPPMSIAMAGEIDLLSEVKEKEVYKREVEKKAEITETYAEVSEAIGVQSFKIPNKMTIPSDKNPHPVNLSVQELESEKKYYWSTMVPENVIVMDKLKNGDLLLLPGNVKLYFLEEFLGETSIPLIAPKEEFKLGTRVSYDLKIDKKIVDRSKAKKAIKGKLKNNYDYKIEIKNLNDVAEQLTILDRIPHSSSEKIKVEIDEIDPEPDKKELGILKWKIPLEGMKDKTINYKYHVEYKQGITITPSLP
jgi:uncharacterized protein (TIGR02231 family)